MYTIGYGNANINGPGIFGGVGIGITANLGAGVSYKNGRITTGFGYNASKIYPGMNFSLDVSNINRVGIPAANQPVVTFGINFHKADLF